MIGSASHAVMAVKGYQALRGKTAKQEQKAAAASKGMKGSSPQAQAAHSARQSAANAIEAKKVQRRNFMEYLKKQPTNFGGTIGDLPPQAQKQIASQYTKSQRRTLMNNMDKESK